MDKISDEDFYTINEHANAKKCFCYICTKVSKIKENGSISNQEEHNLGIPCACNKCLRCKKGEHTFVGDGYQCGHCPYKVTFTLSENPNT